MKSGVGMVVDVNTTRTSLFGTRSDRVEALVGGCVALLVTLGYGLVADAFNTPPTGIESASLWASLACVWLARTENIWTMPYGIVSVVLLGWFLLDIELVGQGWLQYLFYVPVQLFGWWAWARGGEGRTELPVTRLSSRQWVGVAAIVLAAWAACYLMFDWLYETPSYLAWDTSIVASSIMAQSLMTWKKRESWLFWSVPVNISSIGLFYVTDADAFVFLYGVFLLNSVWGWRMWSRQLAVR